ncbi:putative lipid II flippase FtsW [Anaerotruncus sp. AF02-27]|nr:putative lipid II flippase FtsW [Anaerotruncus sp. AF02-27]
MDLTFLILVLLLLSIGLIMLFSASYAYAYYHDGNSFYYISRQLFFAIVGVIMMLIISRIDYHILHRLALPIFAGTIFLLIFALVFPYRSDAKRWINLGFTTFQPSELAKFALVVLFAHLISINYEKMKDPKYGVWPFLGIMGVIALLMLLEPHLSGTILIVSIGIVMMFVGGTDIKWFMLGGGLLIGGIIVMVLIPGVVEYAESRFIYWINPWDAPQGAGYQTIQSLYAIGSGGLMGVGIGNSRQKHLYLPEPQNDFVFSVVCEELGFIGAAIIILIFVLLVWRGYVIAMRCRDRFGSMLSVGLTTQVGVQTILNIAVVSNTVPNTGISLPFFSYGGTALVMLLCQMGVILSVSRQSSIEKE